MAFAALLAIAAGCSDLTDVDTLDVVALSDLENREGARTLAAGAIHDFRGAFAGGFFGQAPLSGIISDEMLSTTSSIDLNDRRELEDPGGGSLFADLAGARVALLRASDFMQRFDAEAAGDISELFSLAGYTEQFFGENFCSGVPLSAIVDGQPEYGEQLTTAQLFERALAHFETASNAAAAEADPLNLARVGQGRALLHLGRYAEAASAVANVPTDFAYEVPYYSGLQQNYLWRWFYYNKQYTIPDNEGTNGLDFVAAGDPRIETEYISPQYVLPVYAPVKYPTESSPVILASGIEARLIEAEALLNAADASGALAKLNDLRATVPGLAPLSAESSQDARIDQLFRERAFWLFLTGQRHGDLRRLVRQYGRDQATVFPSGLYHDGPDSYGSDVDLGIPATEGGNPNMAGSCLARGA